MKRLLLILIAVWLCGVVSAQSIFRLQYWFDGQHDNMVTALSSNGKWQTPIETNQLPNGFHTLYIQVQDSTEQWFSPRSFFFYRVPDTMTNQGVRYTYWFDNDSEHLFSDSISTGHFLLDASMLTDGFHTVNFQFIFSNSASFKSYLFYKTPSFPNATDSIEYVFWFDQDFDHRQSGFCLQEHLVFDIDSLSAGFHTLNAQFIDGNNTTFKSFQFYKRPHNEIQIVKYEYWFNDQDSLKQSISITSQDTFDLVTLMPVPAIPIRSTYFHFNPNNGNPLVNAKNDIHFRVYNAKGYTLSRTKTYYDVTVVDTVYADTLERNTTQTIAAPTNNHIHWFKLGVGIGDSLSFRTDKLCTMQLYAPSGEMVFHASNDSVLTWDGCHAWEQGDYYLAIHDATDTGTISVSYQWIYRYAILAWDVHRVGNGGVSNITFEGNGFSSLDTMFLVRGTDTIPTLYINRESNTTVSIYFNFEGIDTGMFNGAFVYVDEDLFKTEVVFVEGAKPIVLTTTCSYPLQFLMGDVVTYTYTITNTGNMTAYQVPMQVYISSNDFKNIQHIDFQGLKLKKLYSYINCFDSLDSEDQAAWIEYSRQIGDLHYFIPHINANEDGDSVAIYLGYFFDNIAPYETKTLSLNIVSFGTIEVWLSMPDNWVALKDSIEGNISENESKSSNHFCCWHDSFEIWATHVSQGAGVVGLAALVFPELFSKAVALGATVISVGSTALSLVSQIVASQICQGRYGNEQLIGWGGIGVSVAGLFLGGVSGLDAATKIFRGLAGVGSIVSGIPGMVDNYANRESVRKSPECTPPEPDPQGGPSFPWISIDPNEITGYIAESGSLSVSAEQMQMPYVIEFENDTTLATANAHTIVVKDTLDGTVFDLNSMSATAFSIGEHLETVNSGQSFVRTVDMRPAIDIIAQVRLDYHIDTTFAVATWTFSSLDPLTLLPTSDPTLGILPPNFNGDGVGEVNFTINRKANLPDSTLIHNRATIIFDYEEPISTSTWVNIVDNIPPTSTIDSVVFESGTTTLSMHATDNLSGVWRYNVYGKLDENTWQPVAMQIPADSVAVFEIMEDQFITFRTTAIDSAGNVEPLAPAPTTPTVYDSLFITACESYVWFDSLYTASGEYVHTKVSTIPIIADSVTSLYLTINHGTYNAETVTVCDNYEWHGETYTTSGTYTYEYTNADDCPSVDTLYLTINYSTTSIDEQTACESFTWIDSVTYTESTNEPIFTLMNEAGCDSVITLHLTINNPIHAAVSETVCEGFTWNGTTYTVSGDYTYSHTDANGCTQVDTLHLTINNPVHTAVTETACESYVWNGTTYTVSGDYTYSHADANGCTQVDTLHLTIHNPVHTAVTETACESFAWNGTTYTVSGEYTYSHADANGCTQVDTLHLTINNPVHTAVTETSCESFTWNGETYMVSGDYMFSHADANGCTQVDTLHLTISNPVHTAVTETACESLTWNGTTYTVSGDYTYSHADANGCTQVDTLHLTIHNPVHTAVTETACESFTWNGTTYTVSGEYTYSHPDANGCTQVDTLHLTINNPVHIAVTETACESYTWNGTMYTVGGDYMYSHPDANGCTQVDTLHLTINNPVHTAVIETACESFTWNGTTYTVSGDYTYSHPDANGCTQVDTLHLTINNPVHIAVTETACESYTWNSTTYTVSGDYTYSHTDANGCTQVDTLHLTINNPVHTAVTETACESFTWNGVEYTVSGDYTYIYADVNGCTQVDTLHLTINNPVHTAVTETACESYAWNGTMYTVGGDYMYSHPDANGCTQVDTLHLTIFSNETSEFTIATEEPCYTWNNVEYCESGDYIQTLQTIHGCDSVVTLYLTITVGLNDYNGCDFKVYPNPTSNVVNIECIMKNEEWSGVELHLCDAYGRLLDVVETGRAPSLQTVRIDMSRYANGIYFVKAVADGKTIAVRKVVKQ